jgi:GNAT superfamily N-acetyltransferase
MGLSDSRAMDAAERIAAGMVDAERKRRERVVGAEVLEIDGLVLCFSNLPDPALNSIVVEREPRDPSDSMERAEVEFERRRQPIGIDLEVRRHPALDEAVRSMGLSLIIERPGMSVSMTDLASAPAPDGVEIREVADEVGARAVVDVGVEAFGDDPAIGMAFYGAASFGVAGAHSFVAWDGDDPVGIASGYQHAGAVGVMGVGVVPSARRRGIGAAVTAHAARSFPGSDLAWLHPSPEARAMYERIGFRQVADYEVWVRSA